MRTNDPVPPNIIDLHRSLIVDIATAYLEENAVWGAPSPIDFVREYLSNEVNFDPLTATWLLLLDELLRTEMANGLGQTEAHGKLGRESRHRKWLSRNKLIENVETVAPLFGFGSWELASVQRRFGVPDSQRLRVRLRPRAFSSVGRAADF